MNKKKLNGLLLLSLALLFISLLGTTSLAYEYTITNSDLDLIVDRYLPSYLRTEFKNRLHTQLYDINNVQHYDTCVVMVRYYSYYYHVFLYGFNSSDVTKVSNAKNVNYMTITLSNPGKKYGVSYYPNYTNIWRQEWTGGQFGSGGQLDTRYLCVPNDLGNNLFSGPWQSTNVITFVQPTTFTYARSEIDTELIDLDNTYYFNNQAEAVLFAYNPFSGDEINEADGVIVGYLWDADKFDKAIFSRYNFNPTTRLFEYSGLTWESKNIGNIHDNMIWVELHARDYGKALKPDSIIHVEFVPNTTEFNHIHVDYYIRSPYSNIVDGKLNIGGTFSGDYSLMINNDTNTDKIINNVNDDSNVVGQLNEFVSGDTEDLAKKLGFQLIGGMDYYNFIQNTIRNTFNILAEEENVYFDYSMHGETPIRIYASNFTTPPSLFKTFGCLFLIACTIFVFYFQMTTFFESLATLQFTSAVDWLTIDRSIFRM